MSHAAWTSRCRSNLNAMQRLRASVRKGYARLNQHAKQVEATHACRALHRFDSFPVLTRSFLTRRNEGTRDTVAEFDARHCVPSKRPCHRNGRARYGKAR